MSWLSLERELPRELAGLTDGAELAAHCGWPGPWRIARGRGGLVLACDLPAAVEEASSTAALHAWAIRNQVCLHTPPPSLTASSADPVHVAGLHASGGWIDTPERRALVYDLGALPAGVRAAAWARALCHDAMRRWRWVRLGIDAQQTVVAEINLTGLPEDRLPHLQALARAALHRVVAWVLPSLSLLREPGRELRVLELQPLL